MARCAGNRSSDGRLRFRKLPIRYRDAAICKNGDRRWPMREWLGKLDFAKKKKDEKRKTRERKKKGGATCATGTSAFRGGWIFKSRETSGEIRSTDTSWRGRRQIYLSRVRAGEGVKRACPLCVASFLRGVQNGRQRCPFFFAKRQALVAESP